MVNRRTDTSASNLDSCKYLVVMSYVRICIVVVVGRGHQMQIAVPASGQTVPLLFNL